jgi:ferredoxin
MPKLIFIKTNSTLQLKAGTELLRIPHIDASAPLKFSCCQGDCGTCAIKIIKGSDNLSAQTKKETATLKRLQLDGCRLACQCAILDGDVIIHQEKELY